MHNRLKCSLNRISSSIILTILLIGIISSTPSSLNAQTTTNNSNPALSIKESVSSGDVNHNSAVIWSRANNNSLMHVIYDNNLAFSHPNLKIKGVNSSTDFAGKIKIDELHSNTKYFYKVWFSSNDNRTNSSSIVGSFRTAPSPTSSGNSISFILGADVGGQKFCREVNNGYLIFEKMKSLLPDF